MLFFIMRIICFSRWTHAYSKIPLYVTQSILIIYVVMFILLFHNELKSELRNLRTAITIAKNKMRKDKTKNPENRKELKKIILRACQEEA